MGGEDKFVAHLQLNTGEIATEVSQYARLRGGGSFSREKC